MICCLMPKGNAVVRALEGGGAASGMFVKVISDIFSPLT